MGPIHGGMYRHEESRKDRKGNHIKQRKVKEVSEDRIRIQKK